MINHLWEIYLDLEITKHTPFYFLGAADRDLLPATTDDRKMLLVGSDSAGQKHITFIVSAAVSLTQAQAPKAGQTCFGKYIFGGTHTEVTLDSTF